MKTPLVSYMCVIGDKCSPGFFFVEKNVSQTDKLITNLHNSSTPPTPPHKEEEPTKKNVQDQPAPSPGPDQSIS